jgi:hypothetical protein
MRQEARAAGRRTVLSGTMTSAGRFSFGYLLNPSEPVQVLETGLKTLQPGR